MPSVIEKFIRLAAIDLRWSISRLSSRLIKDEKYIAWKYKQRTGRRLNLKNPQRFTEKLQWLKLNWRNDLLTQCADKYAARQFVLNRVGPDLLNQLYGVYDRAEEINIAQLPDAFVLKVNHGCKQNIICPDKKKLDWEYTRRLLSKWLQGNNFYHSREWAYKNIVPKITCEKYLTENNQVPTDYKFFCFNGIPRFVQTDSDRFCGHKKYLYDMNWKIANFSLNGSRTQSESDNPPRRFSDLQKYAAKLAAGFPFVRVDLYCVADQIYFGEMTFYPTSGFGLFTPDETDFVFGSLLELPTL